MTFADSEMQDMSNPAEKGGIQMNIQDLVPAMTQEEMAMYAPEGEYDVGVAAYNVAGDADALPTQSKKEDVMSNPFASESGALSLKELTAAVRAAVNAPVAAEVQQAPAITAEEATQATQEGGNMNKRRVVIKTPTQQNADLAISIMGNVVALAQVARAVTATNGKGKVVTHLPGDFEGHVATAARYAIGVYASKVLNQRELVAQYAGINPDLYALYEAGFQDLIKAGSRSFTKGTGVFGKAVGGRVMVTLRNNQGGTIGVLDNFNARFSTNLQKVTLVLDATTLSAEANHAYARVVFSRVTGEGRGTRYNNAVMKNPAFQAVGNIPAKGEPGMTLWGYAKEELNLIETMILIQTFGANILKSLWANPAAFWGVQAKERDGQWMHAVTRPMALFPQSYGFWGVTGLELLKKGLSRAHADYAQWLEMDSEGNLVSTENAGKLLARVDKLCKDAKRDIFGNKDTTTVTYGKTFLLNKWVQASFQARGVLATGQWYVNAKDFGTYGVTRVVSSANKGGIKATTCPMADLSPTLYAQDCGLMSWQSLKAGRNGVEAMGVGLEQEVTFFIACGTNEYGNIVYEEVTASGWMVDEVEVEVTNFYTINQFLPTGVTSDLSIDEVTEARAGALVDRSTNLREDKAFVERVLAVAEDKGGLYNALTAMLEAGEIRQKAVTTEITPTEWDVMALTHGKAKAELVMDKVLSLDCNKSKVYAREFVKAFMTRKVPAGSCIHVYSAEALVNMALAQVAPMYNEYGDIVSPAAQPSTLCGKTANRNAIAGFVNALYQTEEDVPSVQYIVVKHEASGESMILPTGRLLEGQTFDSNPNLPFVVVSGLLGKIMGHFEYLLNACLSGDNPTEGEYAQFVRDVRNEVEAKVTGKDFGKLTVPGSYTVLQNAPWSESLHTVFWSGLDRVTNKGGIKAIGTKMPLWQLEGHHGVVVKNKADYVNKLEYLTAEERKENLFLTGCVTYQNTLVTLAQQNDSDGDLYRLAFVPGVELPVWSGVVLEDGYWLKDFGLNKVKDEMSYADNGKELKGYKPLSFKELYAGHTAALEAKEHVALYTDKFFRALQVLTMDLETPRAKVTLDLMASFIQYFAMDNIKHNTTTGKNSVDELYSPRCQDRSVPAMEIWDAYELDDVFPLGVNGTCMDRTRWVEGLEWIMGQIIDVKERTFVATLLTQDRAPGNCAAESVYGVGLPMPVSNSMLDKLYVKLFNI